MSAIESKHTPGPWSVDGFNMSNVIRKTSDAGAAGTWDVLARVQGENWRADTLLVAAAPDLLAAVYLALDEAIDWDDFPDVVAVLHAAAAKAEGIT